MVSGSYLRGRNDFLTNSDNARYFAPDRFRVFNFQRPGAAPAGTNAAGSNAPGENENHILSEAGDLRFHLRFCAVADPNHGNDGANADDDAERGQHRTQFVSPQSAERDAKCWCNSHSDG